MTATTNIAQTTAQTTAQTKPVNYLQNRTLLEQIHLSKNSYCWWEQPHYHRYDYIVDRDSLEESLQLVCSPPAIATATAEFVKREGRTPRKQELVFRVMTTEHIPPGALEGSRARAKAKGQRKQEVDYDADDEDDSVDAGVPFPPFKHYRFTDSDSLVVCGISHWQDGKFSTLHGTPTKELALAWIQLCERYSTKWNWRGYSYIDEMRAYALQQLVQVGLRFNEARSDNPFAYFTAIVNNAFIRQLKREKAHAVLRDDLLNLHGKSGSWSNQDND